MTTAYLRLRQSGEREGQPSNPQLERLDIALLLMQEVSPKCRIASVPGIRFDNQTIDLCHDDRAFIQTGALVRFNHDSTYGYSA